MPIYNLVYGIKESGGGGWQPGANTLVYFPFSSDMLDHSGNSVSMITNGTINISNSAPNIGTALYVNYGSMDSSNTLSTGGSLTILGWIYQTQAPLYDNAQVFGFGIDQNAGSPSGCNFIYANSNGPAEVFNKPGIAFFNYSPRIGSTAYRIDYNTWYHFCGVYDSATGKTSMYVNGQYYTEYTSGRSDSSLYWCISRSVGLNRSFYGYMSELIGESKARTAQEISDYYNATRENYSGGGPTTSTYTISNIPTSDTNVYVNVAQSGKTIDSVKFSFTANYTGSQAYIQISGNNSNTNRYGLVFGRNTSGTAPAMAIRGRLGGSDTYYRSITDGFNSSGSNTVEYTINISGSCSVKCNGTTSTYTATGAELTVLQTIMNLSDMNVYSAQNSSLLSNNQVDVEVTYS